MLNKTFVFVLCLAASNVWSQNYQVNDKVNIDSIMNRYNIKDYKGKYIILDFWATWCGSCLTAFPKVHSLQDKYAQSLKVVPVTYQSSKEIASTINDLKRVRNLDIKSITNDTILRKWFPSTFIPHYVWISPSGIVKAITGASEIHENNVIDFIGNKPISVNTASKLLVTEMKAPLYEQNKEKMDQNFLYRSMLTKGLDNMGGSIALTPKQLVVTNFTVRQLYALALSNFNIAAMEVSRCKFENFTSAEDSFSVGSFLPETYQSFLNVIQNHVYTYELIYPDTVSDAKKSARMKQDLDAYFADLGIEGTLERVKTKVCALVRISAEDKIKTSGGKPKRDISSLKIDVVNYPLGGITSAFGVEIPNPSYYPIDNQTGFPNKYKVDLQFDLVSSIDEINKQLAKYDLKFEEREKEIEMVVIRKKNLSTAMAF